MTNQAKVGIFAAVIIAIFVLGFYFLKGIDVFEPQNVYYAVYDRVDGLYKGNLIEINGLPIGRVGKMARDPKSGKIVVEMVLNNDIQVPNSDSTVALLISTDLLGSKKVRLVFGEADEFMKEGDTINTEFRKDLSEQFDPVVADVKKIIPQVDSAITNVKWLFDQHNPAGIYATLGGFNEAVGHVNTILKGNEANIDQMFKNLQSVTRNLEKNNAAITAIITNAGSITDSLKQANLKQAIGNLNDAVVQLDSVLANVNEGKGTVGKLVKSEELYTHIDSAVANLNHLLVDVKQRPYRYINVSVFGSKKREKRIEQKNNESNIPAK